MRAISPEILMISMYEMSLKIMFVNLLLHLLGANELIICQLIQLTTMENKIQIEIEMSNHCPSVQDENISRG